MAVAAAMAAAPLSLGGPWTAQVTGVGGWPSQPVPEAFYQAEEPQCAIAQQSPGTMGRHPSVEAPLQPLPLRDACAKKQEILLLKSLLKAPDADNAGSDKEPEPEAMASCALAAPRLDEAPVRKAADLLQELLANDNSMQPSVEAKAGPTSLVLHNLHPSLDQDSTRKWLDEEGFCGKYDFLLFFPARAGKNATRSTEFPKAFVNFFEPRCAEQFMARFHKFRFADVHKDAVKSRGMQVAPARRQGFVENYLQFAHLLHGQEITQCKPFFAEESERKLSQDVRGMAAKKPSAADVRDHVPDQPFTTLAVRNTPPALAMQCDAQTWFDGMGYAGKYNFFLAFKGYFFVNFEQPDEASLCVKQLHGKMLEGSKLDVAISRKQGLAELKVHFASLPVVFLPWMKPATMNYQ